MPDSPQTSRVPLADIVRHLDETLHLDDFADDESRNGLQVEGAPNGVAKICFGVDASPEFYAEAQRRGADMLVVHHGISWGGSLGRIEGANYQLVAPLIRSGTALYAAHLPLDAHPVLGNNAGLAGALGLGNLAPFGTYRGHVIGIKGAFSQPVAWSEVLDRLRRVCPDGDLRHVDAGRTPLVRTAGIVSGGGSDEFPQAVAEGLDAFITGEIRLQDYNALQTQPIHFAAAGHYATERFGVQALARHLAEAFPVECEFIDLHLPY